MYKNIFYTPLIIEIMRKKLVFGLMFAVLSATVVFSQESAVGEYRIRLDISKRNISWSEGVGINGSFKDGSLFEDGYFKMGISDLKPGVVRWGGAEANKYGLYTVTGAKATDADGAVNPDTYYKASIGKARKELGLATHAMNMDYCNSIGAYYSLSVGVKDDDDWTVDYLNPETGYKVFQNLIEYLAAPSTTAYGAIRAEEGFDEPVLANGKSKGVIIEFGSDVWNEYSTSKKPFSYNDKYAEWCGAMADSMRKSPYWDEVKDMVFFSFSGRSLATEEVSSTISYRKLTPGQIDLFAMPGYFAIDAEIPHVDYETTDHYYRWQIYDLSDKLKKTQSLLKRQMAIIGAPLSPYICEAQLSSAGSFGFLGQATILLDYLTASLKYGAVVPAIYDYSSGQWAITNNHQPLAHYEMARLINTYCKGHLVESKVATDDAILFDRTYGEFEPIEGFDPVGTSVYNNGKNWSILLFSRDFENEYLAQINLPDDIGEIKNVKRHVVTGNDPSIRLDFTLIENEAATLKDGDDVSVPPYSMVLYTFEADDPDFEALPLGNFDRVKPQTLELTGTPSITVNAGNTRITAVVTPEDAFNPSVVWAFSDETIRCAEMSGFDLPTLSLTTDAATIRATGGSGATATKACNGVYWLTATLLDNPEVTKSIAIQISNQTTDCAYWWCGIATDGTETEATISVYPSLANEVLFVNTNTDALSTVTIYSSIGVRVMAETSLEQIVELNVASLPTGQYTAVVESNGKAEAAMFVKR